jgi:hypothetical protein
MRLSIVSSCALIVAAMTPAMAGPGSKEWARVRRPTADPGEVIGSTSSGCLRGGKALAARVES